MRRIAEEVFARLSATGQPLVCWALSCYSTTLLLHGRKYFIEWNGSETSGVIGHAIGNDQFAVVEESATGIDDVRHVAFALLLIRFEQRLAEAADHFARVVVIEKEGTDAIRSKGADPVTED